MKKIVLMAAGLALFTLASQAEGEGDVLTKAREGRRAEILKKFDKNGDGQLDETEKAAAREETRKKREEERLKKYDKNGDGKLDDAEKETMREDLKKRAEEGLKRREGKAEKKGPGKKAEAPTVSPATPAAPAAPQK
jgi:Ca2+-binding EF-hand superfamily protein